MPSGQDHALVEIVAGLVPLVANGCALLLGSGAERRCVAAAHVDPRAERTLRDSDALGSPPTAHAVVTLDGEVAGELVAWTSRTPSSLEEALICSAAERASSVLEKQRAERRARRAEAACDQLVALVGHELRAPVQALTLGLHLMRTRLEDTADDLPRAWLIDRLKRLGNSVTRVHRLAERLVEGEGEIALDRSDVEMGAVVARVADALRDDLAWAGCTLEVSQARPERGRWDVDHLETVLANLLSNAIKYGAGRPIAVAIEGDEDVVRVTVRDHGAGVDPDDAPYVFDRFFRGSTVGRTPGIGLGLFVVRSLVAAHGGTVTCDVSGRREGATFVVRLPRGLATSPALASPR